MSGPSQTYYDLTARPLTPKTQTWIYELSEKFGEERVTGAMRSLAGHGDIDKLLERVRKALATEDARHVTDHPIELDPVDLMAIVRGEAAPPSGAWTYDTRHLSRDEYAEVLRWAGRRREARAS